MEASESSYATLRVELKDRYNNLVFTDDQTEVSIEIPEAYSNIIKYDTPKKTVER
jgi:anti-sigma regulatory factor (Ser/Thr protein kinase)